MPTLPPDTEVRPQSARLPLPSNAEPTVVLADCVAPSGPLTPAENLPVTLPKIRAPEHRHATTIPPKRRQQPRLKAVLAMGTLVGLGSVLGWFLFSRVLTQDTASLRAGSSVAELRADLPLEPKAKAMVSGTATTPEKQRNESQQPAAQKSPVRANSAIGEAGLPWVDTPEASVPCAPQPPTDEVSPFNAAQARIFRDAGIRRLMAGNLAASLKALCRAAELNPKDAGVALDISRAALMYRAPKGATRWAEQTLSLVPGHRTAHELLADALAWQGQVEAATILWLQIHKLKNPSEKTLNTLKRGAVLDAKAAFKTGNFPRAERLLRRALVFDQTDPAVITLVARAALQQKQPKSAQRWIESATALDPEDSLRQLLAGDIHRELDHHEQARQHYNHAVELDPNNAMARLRLSQ